MIALLNLSVLGFSFVVVFHDKAKQQGDLLLLNPLASIKATNLGYSS